MSKRSRHIARTIELPQGPWSDDKVQQGLAQVTQDGSRVVGVTVVSADTGEPCLMVILETNES